MADKTGIEWTEATWNPVTGCSKVSQGCKHCYAERDWARLSANPKTVYFGRPFTDVMCHPERLDQPLRWTKPRRIFVNSMSDLFHEDVPDDFLPDVFAVMAVAKQHTFQILTKRHVRMHEVLNDGVFFEAVVCSARGYGVELKTHDWPLQNVWIGISLEDQITADERIPLLLQTPAIVRWISAEPLLGPVDLSDYLEFYVGTGDTFGLDWIVAGGESGTKARPMHPDWVRSLRDQCLEAGVPFLFKQWGEWLSSRTLPPDTRLPANRWGWISKNGGAVDSMHSRPFKNEFSHHELMGKIGKKIAGRRLDGEVHNNYPMGAA